MQGVSAASYWNESKPNLRDEFFLIVNTMFGLIDLAKKIDPNQEWMTEYEVAFLIQSKTFSQNILSIDKLVHSNCYIDAFIICRTILSRVNLLTLFSLNPTIYNNWLIEPTNKKFIDGNVRKELKKFDLPNFNETYKYLSSLIHGQFAGSAEAGIMEKGLFTKVIALDNKIYTISKILLAMACFGLLSLLIIDQSTTRCNEAIQEYDTLFSFYFEDILAFNKIENMLFLIQDMDLVHLEGNRFTLTNSFDFKHYRESLVRVYTSSS